ncbi:MAG: hypothetical protein IH591_15705 [Bacteroidales bacterium]|nr:hypothetical protein [Bacteroidales bacterium]
MKPEVDKWQPFVSFSDVDVKEIDLYDDAWGFSQILASMMDTLPLIEVSPSDSLIEELLCKIELTGK